MNQMTYLAIYHSRQSLFLSQKSAPLWGIHTSSL